MQNDTISRSALVAELEAFKMSLGDVVLRLIVDRVIDLVKAHKAVEAPVRYVDKSCDNCRHRDVDIYAPPCSECVDIGIHSKWEEAAAGDSEKSD